MFQFGDDLIVQKPGAPLVIWIQLLVIFLLLLLSLLSSSVSLFSPDHPSPSSAANPPSPASIKSCSGSRRGSSLSTAVVSRSCSFQEAQVVGASRTAGLEASAAVVARAVRSRVEIGREEERVGLDRSSSSSSIEEEAPHGAYYHPCYCIRLAGMAFIKCFGLDST